MTWIILPLSIKKPLHNSTPEQKKRYQHFKSNTLSAYFFLHMENEYGIYLELDPVQHHYQIKLFPNAIDIEKLDVQNVDFNVSLANRNVEFVHHYTGNNESLYKSALYGLAKVLTNEISKGEWGCAEKICINEENNYLYFYTQDQVQFVHFITEVKESKTLLSYVHLKFNYPEREQLALHETTQRTAFCRNLLSLPSEKITPVQFILNKLHFEYFKAHGCSHQVYDVDLLLHDPLMLWKIEGIEHDVKTGKNESDISKAILLIDTFIFWDKSTTHLRKRLLDAVTQAVEPKISSLCLPTYLESVDDSVSIYLLAAREKPWHKAAAKSALLSLPYLTDKQFYTLSAELLSFPNLTKKIIPMLARLDAIELESLGESFCTWREFAASFFSRDINPFTIEKNGLAAELSDVIAKEKDRIPTKCNIKDLIKDYTFLRVQGRTLLFKKIDGEEILAIKIQKKSEALFELQKQCATVTVLKKNQQSLDLRSEIPTAVGVFTVNSIKEYLQEHLTEKNTDNFLSAIDWDGTDDSSDAYVYKAINENYFIYLRDSKVSFDDFLRSALICMHDFLILLKQGLVYDRLADMFHDMPIKNNAGRRFIPLFWLLTRWSRFQTPGRFHNWQTAVAFANFRLKNMADEGDYESIEQYADINSDVVKKFFSSHSYSAAKNSPVLKENMLKSMIPNFICEAFTVLELLQGSRISAEKETKHWHQAAQDLNTIFGRTFSEIYELTSSSNDSRTLIIDMGINLFKQVVDNRSSGRLMQYWMTGEYIEAVKNNPKLDPQLYGSNVVVTIKPDDFREIAPSEKRDKDTPVDEGPGLGPRNGPNPLTNFDLAHHIFAGFSLVAPKCLSQSQSNRYLVEAEQERKAGNNSQAEASYLAALQYWPLSHRAYFGLMLLQNNKPQITSGKQISPKEKYAGLMIYSIWRTKKAARLYGEDVKAQCITQLPYAKKK